MRDICKLMHRTKHVLSYSLPVEKIYLKMKMKKEHSDPNTGTASMAWAAIRGMNV